MDRALLHSWMMKIKPFCKVCDYRVGVLKTHGFLTNEKICGCDLDFRFHAKASKEPQTEKEMIPYYCCLKRIVQFAFVE